MDVREKLVELLDDMQRSGTGYFGTAIENKRIADYLIRHGVTVQERGNWEDDHGDYVCSCCHTVFSDDLLCLVHGESNEPNYCPNCGAKMDGCADSE